jgi:NAD(P)-dependent dehydrogenase (short-subunit alcohol dehydrogenase family)
LSEEESEMPDRISLAAKVAVVTGAGRGLGRAYAELLAERGARVVVNDLGTDVSGFGEDSAVAEQVAGLIRSRGGEAVGNGSDVSTPEGGRDLIAAAFEHFGRIDLLVNNAGICGSQLFEDATLDDFDHYWRVHLGGPVNTVKAAWPHMVAQRYGKIVLVTSVAGLFGIRGQATYAAAKCAVKANGARQAPGQRPTSHAPRAPGRHPADVGAGQVRSRPTPGIEQHHQRH